MMAFGFIMKYKIDYWIGYWVTYKDGFYTILDAIYYARSHNRTYPLVNHNWVISNGTAIVYESNFGGN